MSDPIVYIEVDGGIVYVRADRPIELHTRYVDSITVQCQYCDEELGDDEDEMHEECAQIVSRLESTLKFIA